MRWWAFVLWAAVVALGGCADARSRAAQKPTISRQPTVDLPLYRLEGGHVVVPVRLADGGVEPFLLDTGASLTVVTPKTSARSGVGASEGSRVEGRGAAGSLRGVRRVVLRELQVGPVHYQGLGAAVVDLTHLGQRFGVEIAGILGANFLAGHAVEIDFPQDRLRFHPRDAVSTGQVATGELERMDFDLFEVGGLMRVLVRVDGGPPMPAVFDLGAGRSVMNWRAAAAVGITPRSDGVAAASETLFGVANESFRASTYRFAKISSGTWSQPEPEIMMADLPVFSVLGVNRGPAMVLGLDLLEDRRVVLDYAGKRVFLSGSTRPTEAP